VVLQVVARDDAFDGAHERSQPLSFFAAPRPVGRLDHALIQRPATHGTTVTAVASRVGCARQAASIGPAARAKGGGFALHCRLEQVCRAWIGHGSGWQLVA
jgi:hypothetical protein